MTTAKTPLRSVALGDVTLAYEDHGVGERPLVLVHGFTGSRDDFADVTGALADLGRLVLVDQRGHGDSSNPGAGYTFAQLVVDLLGLFDAAGIARADLLGHSLGGMVALRFALAHPERVASLILMDTGARAVPVLGAALARAVASVRRHGTSRIVAASAVIPLAGEELQIAGIEGAARYQQRARAKLEKLDPQAFVALAPYLGEHTPVTERLSEIRCPVTVIVGANDAPFLPLADELAAGIAGAALVRIPDAGHSPQKSARDAWLAAVRAHVTRARSAAN